LPINEHAEVDGVWCLTKKKNPLVSFHGQCVPIYGEGDVAKEVSEMIHNILFASWLEHNLLIWIFTLLHVTLCHNLSFGLMTKAMVYKGAGQEWSLGDTFHVPRSVGECEGMNPHIPKWVSTLGVGVSMDS